MNANMVEQIKNGMAKWSTKIVVSQGEGYIRVWNCLCGGIMGVYNNDLDTVAKANGLKVKRVRTYGNGMISAADWEDQLTPIA